MDGFLFFPATLVESPAGLWCPMFFLFLLVVDFVNLQEKYESSDSQPSSALTRIVGMARFSNSASVTLETMLVWPAHLLTLTRCEIIR